MGFKAKTGKAYRAQGANPAKIFLFGYRSLLNQQEAILDALAEYRERSTRATSRLTATRVSGTGFCSPLECNAIKTVDAERELKRDVDEIGERLQAILDAINSLADERHKEILKMRYIAGYSWDRIFSKINYEKSRVYEMHGEALVSVKNFIAGGGK